MKVVGKIVKVGVNVVVNGVKKFSDMWNVFSK